MAVDEVREVKEGVEGMLVSASGYCTLRPTGGTQVAVLRESAASSPLVAAVTASTWWRGGSTSVTDTGDAGGSGGNDIETYVWAMGVTCVLHESTTVSAYGKVSTTAATVVCGRWCGTRREACGMCWRGRHDHDGDGQDAAARRGEEC